MRTQTLSSSKCSTQATVELQPIELNSELKSKRGFKPRLELANCHGETYIQKAKEEINGNEIIKWIKPKATE
jgi:hypothetical protein